MLTAFKPDDNIYDMKKFYIRKNLIKLNSKKRKFPIINVKNSTSNIKIEPLTQREIHSNINLDTLNNSIRDNNFIPSRCKFSSKVLLNDSGLLNSNVNKNRSGFSSNVFLPKLNSLSNEKNKIKINHNKRCNYLYLKYEGEEFINEAKNKIYIQINPHKIINSIEKIIKNNKIYEIIFNKLNTNNNLQKPGKYLKININNNNLNSNVINNLSTNNNSLDNNNIINSNRNENNEIDNFLEENNYFSNSDTEYNSNEKYDYLIRTNKINVKKILLSNIVHNVYDHFIEIKDIKNEIIDKNEIKNELDNQISSLKTIFINKLKKESKTYINENNNSSNRATQTYKKINKIKIHSIKNFNHSQYNKNEDTFNSNNNLTNFNKFINNNKIKRGNKELLDLFKEKLNIQNFSSIHNLYNNIFNSTSNINRESFENNSIIKKKNCLNTFRKKIYNKEKNFFDSKENLLNNNSSNFNYLLNFYKQYKNINSDINIYSKNNMDYIFELGPKLHFVEFNEIIDEIESLSYNENEKNNYLENLLYFILKDESLYNKVKYQNSIMKKYLKFFSSKIKNKKKINIKKLGIIKNNFKTIQKKYNILGIIGNKLHKKIKTRIGKKNKNLTIDTITDIKNKREKSSKTKNKKKRKSEISKINIEEKNYNLTHSIIIDTETNSSEYSDVPSYISYSQIKKQKEEQSQKIKELIDKNKMNAEEIEKLIFKPNQKNEEKNINEKKYIQKIIKKNTIEQKNEKSIQTYEQNKNKNSDIKQKNDFEQKKDNKKLYLSSYNNSDKAKNTNLILQLESNDINNKENNEIYDVENKTDKNFNINNKSIEEIKKLSKNNFNQKSNSKIISNRNLIKMNLIKNVNENENKKKYDKINPKKMNYFSEKKLLNKFGGDSNSKKKSFHKSQDKKNIKNENEKESYVKPFKNKELISDNKNKKKRKISKSSFCDLIKLINDELNIPGRNNKLEINALNNSYDLFQRRKNYILNLDLKDDEELEENNKNDYFLKYYKENYNYHLENKKKLTSFNNQKEKNNFEKNKNEIIDKKYKTLSYFNIKNDSRLLLLRPILKYSLHQDHEQENLLGIINKLFKQDNIAKPSLNLNNSTNSLDSNISNNRDNSSEDIIKESKNISNSQNQIKKIIIKDDNIFLKRKKYISILERYPLLFFHKKYYRDDNDLLYSRRKGIFKKMKKKKRGMGFIEFMIEELNEMDEGNLTDDFENTIKENEKIRKKIKEKREEKRRKREEWNKKFNLFKSNIQKLKKMDELEFKNDSLKFIYKIKEEYERNQIIKLKQSKRINEFKKFLQNHKEKTKLINEYIMRQIIFKPNCIFSSDKIFQ